MVWHEKFTPGEATTTCPRGGKRTKYRINILVQLILSEAD